MKRLTLRTVSAWLGRLEPRQQLWLGVAAGLVLAVWTVRFAYLPVLSRLSDRRSRVQELRVKRADAHIVMERLPAQEARLQTAQAQYRELERRVGRDQSPARVLEQLSEQAKRHRLELTAVQSQPGETASRLFTLGPLTLREVPLTLHVTGRYRMLGEFLGALPQAPFLSSVRSLTVTKSDAEDTALQATLVLAVYLAEGQAVP